MMPEHMESPDPTVGPSSITETGALCCSSGSKTGRVPKDKRIVLDAETKEVSKANIGKVQMLATFKLTIYQRINWGEINIPMSPENFDVNKQRAVDFLNMRKRVSKIVYLTRLDLRHRLVRRVGHSLQTQDQSNLSKTLPRPFHETDAYQS